MAGIFGWMVPKEANFFRFFNEMAEKIEATAKVTHDAIKSGTVTEEAAEKVRALETEADTITHNTITQLHKSFITPFDRDDIHDLITNMDEIEDTFHAAIERFRMFDLKVIPAEIVEMANQALQAAGLITKIVAGLEDINKPTAILELCVKVNKLENDSDCLFRLFLAKLFKNESDLKTLLMYREVAEKFEELLDHCEHLAEIVEGIVLDYA